MRGSGKSPARPAGPVAGRRERGRLCPVHAAARPGCTQLRLHAASRSPKPGPKTTASGSAGTSGIRIRQREKNTGLLQKQPPWQGPATMSCLLFGSQMLLRTSPQRELGVTDILAPNGSRFRESHPTPARTLTVESHREQVGPPWDHLEQGQPRPGNGPETCVSLFAQPGLELRLPSRDFPGPWAMTPTCPIDLLEVPQRRVTAHARLRVPHSGG
ncbi:uncharacterized protein LOC104872501 [Fukomys damarensis]|uniref:uncharacterized protein LOC104872501 n=1 Tax=Fukomys damarensis TaxID=885580 RepID=UPI0008FF36F8|nr:uncharacterized protein LOC104872501 [Fukomys damarensis]